MRPSPVTVLLTALLLLASVSPAPAARPAPATPGGPILHTDADGSRLFVLDPARGKLAIYSVWDSGARLVAVRDLAADFGSDPAAAAASQAAGKPASPPVDVPGEALPDLLRPTGAVRTRYSAFRGDKGETAGTTYAVPRPAAEVFGEFRSWVPGAGWRVLQETITVQPSGSPHANGHLQLVREGARADIRINSGPVTGTSTVEIEWSRETSGR